MIDKMEILTIWFFIISSIMVQTDKLVPKRGTINVNSDFEDSIKVSTFVDKSFLMDDFFQAADSSPFQLVTCPRLFGKSSNLKMMKAFIDVSVDEEGERIRRKMDTMSYFLFTDPRLHLNIAPLLVNHGFLFRHHFKAFPTIYVNFRNVIGNTYEDILEGLRFSIKNCFESYEWMYRFLLKRYPDNCDETHPVIRNQMKFMRKILNGQMTYDEMFDSLYELSKIIFDFFGRDLMLFLLIDDYDAPIQNAIEYNLNVTQVTRLVERTLSKILHPDSSYIKYALITGTTNVLKNKFSNIKHRGFLQNHIFADYFGFTEAEVEKLLVQHSLDAYEKNAVKYHYKAYTVAGSLKRIYNPISIVKYLGYKTTQSEDIQVENFWAETGIKPNFPMLFKNTKLTDAVAELLITKTISFPARRSWDYRELEDLRRIKHGEVSHTTDYHVRLFLSYLFEHGYLSHTSKLGVFTFPNREIETNIIDHFNAFYTDVCGIDIEPLHEALRPLLEQENTTKELVNRCENVLRKIFYDTKNPHSPFKGNEYQYQAFIYCSAKEVISHDTDVIMVNIDDMEHIKRRAYIVLEKGQGALVVELNYAENQVVEDEIDHQAKVNAIYDRYRAMKEESAILEPQTG